MLQDFHEGDFLIFQLESGFGLMRLLAIDDSPMNTVWHVATYDDFYLDPERADLAIANSESLSLANPHIALTNRAFESTQVARMTNLPLTPSEVETVERWRNSKGEVSDRSIRLMMGLR